MRITCLPFLPAAVLTALLGWAPPTLAQRAPAPPPCTPDAYQGFAPTGYKGNPETDFDWHRRVRAVTSREGGQACQRYVLSAAPRLGPFDSINTVDLGGGVKGFIAQREARSWLFTALGRDVLGGPVTGEIAREDLDNGLASARTVLLSYPGEDGLRHFVRVGRGQIVARSPQGYDVSGGHVTELGSRHQPPPLPLSGIGLLRVWLPDRGMGLLDTLTLREVVPPRYQGSGVLTHADKPWLLFGHMLATPGAPARVDFFLPDGTPLALPAARDFALYHISDEMQYLALTDTQDTACHYLDAQRRPLLPMAVPKLAGYPCPHLSASDPLRFATADGQVHRYLYIPGQGMQALGAPVPGQLLDGRRGRFVLQLPPKGLPAAPASAPAAPSVAAAPARYQVYRDDGQPIPDALGFEGFENLGCGTWRLQREGVWYELDGKDQLSTRLTYPFSC